jgi:hypothetical protein
MNNKLGIYAFDWIDADKPWREYPVGTKARESWTGGYWTKTNMGWKWQTGNTFPTPEASDQVSLPVENDIDK